MRINLVKQLWPPPDPSVIATHQISGEEIEGATKIQFRTKSTWKQINHFSIDGKSKTDIYSLISEAAKEQLQPWLPPLMDEYKKVDSDLCL
jgi:hypothetical protein